MSGFFGSIINEKLLVSADYIYGLAVQAPPVPVVVSVFPDAVEAASDAFVSVGLLNGPSSSSFLFVRTRNGSFVANASMDSARGGVQFFQFSLPNSKLSGSPLVFDVANSLQLASTASTFPFSADFSLFVSAPARPQIIVPPQITSLLIT